ESMQSTLRQARQDKSFNTESLAPAKINANDPDLGKLTLSGGAVENSVGIDPVNKAGKGAVAVAATAYAPPDAAAKASLAGDVTKYASADAAFTIQFGDKTANFAYVADATTPTLAKMADAITAQLANSDLAGKVTFTNTGGKFTF